MKINEKRLSELLGDEVKIFVCDETGSTNEDAKAFLKEHDAEKRKRTFWEIVLLPRKRNIYDGGFAEC